MEEKMQVETKHHEWKEERHSEKSKPGKELRGQKTEVGGFEGGIVHCML